MCSTARAARTGTPPNKSLIAYRYGCGDELAHAEAVQDHLAELVAEVQSRYAEWPHSTTRFVPSCRNAMGTKSARNSSNKASSMGSRRVLLAATGRPGLSAGFSVV